jgi:hypothetical protein
MSIEDDSGEIADGIRSMRVFTGVLLAGVLLFLAVVVAIKWNSRPVEGEDNTVLLVVFLGQATLALLAGLLMPRQMLNRQRKELAQSLGETARAENIPVNKLLIMLRGASIFRLALLEGASFALLICLVVTGQFWLLAIVGVLLVLMLREWPTVAGVTGWIQEQRDRIRQEF